MTTRSGATSRTSTTPLRRSASSCRHPRCWTSRCTTSTGIATATAARPSRTASRSSTRPPCGGSLGSTAGCTSRRSGRIAASAGRPRGSWAAPSPTSPPPSSSSPTAMRPRSSPRTTHILPRQYGGPSGYPSSWRSCRRVGPRCSCSTARTPGTRPAPPWTRAWGPLSCPTATAACACPGPSRTSSRGAARRPSCGSPTTGAPCTGRHWARGTAGRTPLCSSSRGPPHTPSGPGTCSPTTTWALSGAPCTARRGSRSGTRGSRGPSSSTCFPCGPRRTGRGCSRRERPWRKASMEMSALWSCSTTS
mmetsp:Transcript_21129/g.71009  ORF Transcript_21129/g.71009 Transcript_21129/m.71009 type:complete len:306 (-) Transcript_21129:149-1066(-)